MLIAPGSELFFIVGVWMYKQKGERSSQIYRTSSEAYACRIAFRVNLYLECCLRLPCSHTLLQSVLLRAFERARVHVLGCFYSFGSLVMYIFDGSNNDVLTDPNALVLGGYGCF